MTRRLPALLLLLLAYAAGGAAAEKEAAEKEVGQWIVVTGPAFHDALKPLCQHRRDEGMQVVVVRTTDALSAKQIRDGDGRLLKEHVHKLCREAKGPSFVLLVGAAKVEDPDDAVKTVVPTLMGTAGRMEGKPTDNGYGCLGDELLPTVAVGRFPVRTAEEARQMVHKTLAFERDRSPGLWRNRLTLLVGNPGGASAIERRFAEWFVQKVAGTRFNRIHPSWTGRTVIHAPGSPLRVPDDRLREVSLRYMQEGQLFSFYLGHSSAPGFWSEGAEFLSHGDFAKLKI